MGFSSNCPFVYTQKMLSSKWSLLIVYKIDPVSGSRFSNIAQQLNTITNATLSKQLNQLIEKGIISKHDNNSYPRIVTYKLTQKGLDLRKIIDTFEA